MALPKQVQAELDELEAWEQQIAAQQAGENAGEQDTDNAPKPAPVVAAEPEKAVPADPPKAAEDDFKLKYNTLKGKYDAEVPRLHQQIRELTEQMGALKAEVTAKKAEPQKPKEKVSLVTDADKETFGEDLIDVQRRVAREVASEFEDRIEEQQRVIQELREQLSQTGSQMGQMTFEQRLVRLVPDFDTINTDARWVAWLNEHEPMLRGPRRVAAQAAMESGDAEAVAEFVNLWKASLAPAAKQKPSRETELERQVAPNRNSSQVVSATGQETGRVYTSRELETGWDRVREMNSRGEYEKAEKLEAELTAAYMENRVRL